MSKISGGESPWGGRFSRPMDELLQAFSASVHFDSQLYPYDIAGSVAHAKMLGRQGLVTHEEAEAIVQGLLDIKADIEAGRFQWDPALEDVHMNIERELSRRIGPAGDKLHTARSRNDQIALDTRLFMRDALKMVAEGVARLRLVLVRKAEASVDVIMPGYTHLQRAQPVLAAHHLLAYQEMFQRDAQRLDEIARRVDVMPLGSAALAGAGLPIDMKFVATELGFSRVTANSMDSVSDRDYIIEFLSAASLIMMHLSRLSEDVVLWASSEFAFVSLPDELCTGSSIMPQKKNPDTMELIRGKTGRVYGALMSLLTILKGLPMTYNRDLQEDKEPLFDTVQTLGQVLPLAARMVERMSFQTDRVRAAADDPFVTATDLADHLVRQGTPFRQAHAQVGKTVRYCLDRGLRLDELSLEQLRKLCPLAGDGVMKDLTLEASVSARSASGGTAPRRVKAEIRKLLKKMDPGTGR